jgi:uncharacterized protein
MSTSDHSSNGVEALQRFYQAESEYAQTGGEDFGPVAATLHPQIVIIQADSLPFGGQWHGREGFERWMQAFGEAWSSVSATDLRFFEHDDTVVVVAQMEATARASGQSFRAPICHVVRIRDGLLMEFQMFYWDTVATNRALARDQHFVKVMPRDFVGERLSGTGGLPGRVETSEYSYELCGPDPTEDLYWLRQRGRPVIRRASATLPTPRTAGKNAAAVTPVC